MIGSAKQTAASEPDVSLREAMRLVASGVAVVTTGVGADRTGLTATSAVALAIDPPTMLVCINRTASAWPALQRHRRFCVNFLAASQNDIADRFAGRHGVQGQDRYQGAEWTTSPGGASQLAGATAVIDCTLEELIERHSHVIVLGAVQSVRISDTPPLLYSDGRYGIFQSR